VVNKVKNWKNFFLNRNKFFYLGVWAVLLISFCSAYDLLEQTLYYWDFGDYQHTLSNLHGSLINPTQSFFSSYVKIQKSEYPLNWAMFFPFLPHDFFAIRAVFTSYLALCGLIPWAYGAKIFSDKIIGDKRIGNFAFAALMLSPGPWMLVLRGWPDVIALGFIWLGFAIAIKPDVVSKYWMGIFLICFGAVMRKTTVLLASVLLVVLAIYAAYSYIKAKQKIYSTKNACYVLLGILGTIALTPGFYLTIFSRNNSLFYKPFNVNWAQYLNNLFSINGSVQVLIAVLLPVFVLILKYSQREIQISLKFIFVILAIPILHVLLWMKILAQATDHHMVQWVPFYFSISIAVVIKIISVKLSDKKHLRYLLAEITLAIALICLFVITVSFSVTPFGSPRYSFERPLARSIAPIKRPDIVSLVNLGKELKFLDQAPTKTIAVLNESHEINVDIIKDIIRKNSIAHLNYATIGSLDYRDDLGLNELLNSSYFLIPRNILFVIPGYQDNLAIISKAMDRYVADHPKLFKKMWMGKIGAPFDTKAWWNNQYIKSSSIFNLYVLTENLSGQEKDSLGEAIARSIMQNGHFVGSFILLTGPNGSGGPSAINGDRIEFSLNNDDFASVLARTNIFNVQTNCEGDILAESGKKYKIHVGLQEIALTSNSPTHFIIRNRSVEPSNYCRYLIERN